MTLMLSLSLSLHGVVRKGQSMVVSCERGSQCPKTPLAFAIGLGDHASVSCTTHASCTLSALTCDHGVSVHTCAADAYCCVDSHHSLAPCCHMGLPLQGAAMPPVHIKWPNDIYVNGLKIGGVLIHTTWQSQGFNIITGIGMHVCS